MTPVELLAVFRTEVFDLEVPYLWSDALIYAYMDDAQKQFCRDTYGIEDARGFALTINADGTEWYAIDPRILKIRGAINTSDGSAVALIAIEKMSERYMKFDGAVGSTRALIVGMEKGYVRAHPKPNQAATIELHTFRLPNDVTADDDFEIDPQHVLNLLYWIKYRAYMVQDAEARDEKKATENRALHEAYCARAKVEQSRLDRPVSCVTYGGI